jgi:hypothetical protein
MAARLQVHPKGLRSASEIQHGGTWWNKGGEQSISLVPWWGLLRDSLPARQIGTQQPSLGRSEQNEAPP